MAVASFLLASIREAALIAANTVRLRTAPGDFDYRTIKITIVKRVWSGGEAGAGTPVTTTVTDLPQAIRIVPVNERDIAGSGGRYEAGDVKCGPITPAYSVGSLTGGYTPAQLDPAASLGATGIEIIHVLSGAIVGEFRLVDLQQHRAVSYFMVLRRLRTTP